MNMRPARAWDSRANFGRFVEIKIERQMELQYKPTDGIFELVVT